MSAAPLNPQSPTAIEIQALLNEAFAHLVQNDWKPKPTWNRRFLACVRTRHGEGWLVVASSLVVLLQQAASSNRAVTTILNYFNVSHIEELLHAMGNINTQIAGGNQIGLMAGGGTLTIRDLSAFNTMVDQAGATVASPVQAALKDVRKELDGAQIDGGLRDLLLVQLQSILGEVQKGSDPQSGTLGTVWNMFKAGVGGVATVASGLGSAVSALGKVLGLS